MVTYACGYFITCKLYTGKNTLLHSFNIVFILLLKAAELSGSTYRATMGNTIYLINSVGSLYAVITALFIRDYIGLLYLNIIPIIFVLFAFL